MQAHEWIKTGLSAVNTIVIVLGAIFAYREFIDKSGTSETDRVEETYRRVQAISEHGSGFLFGYLFDEDPMPLGFQSGGLTEYQDTADKALGSYYSIALCVKSGKCDREIAERLICPFLLTDAWIINRTFGREISNGGTFIDRARIWSFYEQVESCLASEATLNVDHKSFLARFQDEIDLLIETDRLMFDAFKNRVGVPGSPPTTPN